MIRSEALDITLESRGNVIWFRLAGNFYNEQVPNIREKFLSLLKDGNRSFVVDMEKITGVDDTVVPMFLTLFNTIKGKGGELKLIFKNDSLCRAFQPYINLFAIFPDEESLYRGSLLSLLKKRGKKLNRKTGFRISRSVAIFTLIVLCGWFLTLLSIIQVQSGRIHEQQSELLELNLWKQQSVLETEQLKERLQPLEQLGIIQDAAKPKRR
ncbi:MAG: STAS domain-containing protein [Chitinispirillales bacterium]|jgi:anti-sigma B factor antagonist|nr:STAS domain-containing protein [Chitinispirillales bacterium]